MHTLVLLLVLVPIVCAVGPPTIYDLRLSFPDSRASCASGEAARLVVPSLSSMDGSEWNATLPSSHTLLFLVDDEEQWVSWYQAKALRMERCVPQNLIPLTVQGVPPEPDVTFDCRMWCLDDRQIGVCISCRALTAIPQHIAARDCQYTDPTILSFGCGGTMTLNITQSWTATDTASAGDQIILYVETSSVSTVNVKLIAPTVHIFAVLGSQLTFENVEIEADSLLFTVSSSQEVELKGVNWTVTESLSMDLQDVLRISDASSLSANNVTIKTLNSMRVTQSFIRAEGTLDMRVPSTDCVVCSDDSIILTNSEFRYSHMGLLAFNYDRKAVSLAGSSFSGDSLSWIAATADPLQRPAMNFQSSSFIGDVYLQANRIFMANTNFSAGVNEIEGTGSMPEDSARFAFVAQGCRWTDVTLLWESNGVESLDCVYHNVSGSVVSRGPYCKHQLWAEGHEFVACNISMYAIRPYDFDYTPVAPCNDAGIWLTGAWDMTGSEIQVEVSNYNQFAVLLDDIEMTADAGSLLRINATSREDSPFAVRVKDAVVDRAHIYAYLSSSSGTASCIVIDASSISNSLLYAEISGSSYGQVIGLDVTASSPVTFIDVDISIRGVGFTASATWGLKPLSPIDHRGGLIDVLLLAVDGPVTGVRLQALESFSWYSIELNMALSSASDIVGTSGVDLEHMVFNNVTALSTIYSLGSGDIYGFFLDTESNVECADLEWTSNIVVPAATPGPSTAFYVSDSVLNCTGEVYVSGNCEIDNEQSIGIHFRQTNVTAGAASVNVELVGQGEACGLLIEGSTFDIPEQQLFTDGVAEKEAVILKQSRFNPALWIAIGNGATGIKIEDLGTLESRGHGLSWSFLGYGRDVAFFASPSFALDYATDSVFLLAGIGGAFTDGPVSIEWDDVALQMDWQANSIWITPNQTLEIAGLNSGSTMVLGTPTTEITMIGGDLIASSTMEILSPPICSAEEDVMISASMIDFHGISVDNPITLSVVSDSIVLDGDIVTNGWLLIAAALTMEVNNTRIEAAMDIAMAGGFYIGDSDWEIVVGNALSLLATSIDPATSDLSITGVDLRINTPISSPLHLSAEEIHLYQSISSASIIAGQVQGYNVSVGSMIGTEAAIITGMPSSEPNLRIGSLQGPVTYNVIYSPNQSTRISVERRDEPLVVDFLANSIPPQWDGTPLRPLQQPQDSFPLLTTDGEEVGRFNAVSSIGPEAVSVIRDDRSVPTLTIFRHTPIDAENVTSSELCPCNAAEYCMTVLNSTDPDVLEYVEVSVSSEGWEVNDSKQVCYLLPPDSSNPSVSTYYTISDPISPNGAFAHIFFNFSLVPSPTPSVTSTSSRTATDSITATSSRSVSSLESVIPTQTAAPTSSVSPSTSGSSSSTRSPTPSSSRAPILSPSLILLPPETRPSSSNLPIASSGDQIGPQLTRTPRPSPALGIPLSRIEEEIERGSNYVEIDIPLEGGGSAGTLRVPAHLVPDPTRDLVLFAHATTPSGRQVNEGRRIGSGVADITLVSPILGSITSLTKSLEICLIRDISSSDDSCLGFYDEIRGKWECEDRCLQKKAGSYCGKTGHLTSFALLLGGGITDCGDQEQIFIWLSVAFIASAILCVAVGVVAIEVWIRAKKIRRQLFIRTIHTFPSN